MAETVDVSGVNERSFTLTGELSGVADETERRQIIRRYLEDSNDQLLPICPDFPTECEWFNTRGPLSLRRDLQGKVVVLDFFTYCCINCMHILPDLHALEQKYTIADGVIIVGVHSAKFDNEKVSSNILNAILRYDIAHPVVNDSEACLWHQLDVQCWPTLLILNPNGQIVLSLVGEGHRQVLLDFVQEALQFYHEDVDHQTVKLDLYKNRMPRSSLYFPGKIAADSSGSLLAISDTGHHRILIVDSQGLVQSMIGGTAPGFADGSFGTARFMAPQGVVWKDQDQVYVADTENHAVRLIDLGRGTVETVAGTGEQGRDRTGGKPGPQQPISSPWDLALTRSVDSSEEDVLVIAMAGSHQIWLLFLQDAVWTKNRKYEKGTCVMFAGSGEEENRNNSYPHRAGFAQPSGLSVSSYDEAGQSVMYVADSESSTVRSVTLPGGAVKAFVGGERDPSNLFAYGDFDGVGYEAKLQHPLAVALQTKSNGPLIIADSYNHKIKSVDLKMKMCETIPCLQMTPEDPLGTDLDLALFNEPGGMSMCEDQGLLYICDTNNHAIKVYNVNTKCVKTLQIQFPEDEKGIDETDKQNGRLNIDWRTPGPAAESSDTKPQKRITTKNAAVTVLSPASVKADSLFSLELHVELDRGLHLTAEAPSAWQILIKGLNAEEDSSDLIPEDQPTRGVLNDLSLPTILHFKVPSVCASPCSLTVELKLFVCDDNNTCMMKESVIKQPLEIQSGGNDRIVAKLSIL